MHEVVNIRLLLRPVFYNQFVSLLTLYNKILSVCFHIYRAIFLAATGVIYSASLSNEAASIGFPFDYNITFVLYGACFIVIIFLTACLPSSVNHKKI